MQFNINLLPQQQRERFRHQKLNTYLISWAIILLIFGLGLLALVFFLKTGLAAQSKSLANQIQTVQKELDKKADVKAKVEAFNQIVNVASSLEKSQIIWSKVMTDLANSTPADVQLTQTKLGASGGFTLSGRAASLRSVMKFKEKIEKLNYLSQVEVIKISQESQAKQISYSFEIAGKINLIGKNE